MAKTTFGNNNDSEVGNDGSLVDMGTFDIEPNGDKHQGNLLALSSAQRPLQYLNFRLQASLFITKMFT